MKKETIKWISSTFIGPILVGAIILVLSIPFNRNIEEIKDRLFLRYTNAPQIWGYDPLEYTTDKIFHNFECNNENSKNIDHNPNYDFAVQYLWADPYSFRRSHNSDVINGGYARVSANVIKENILRIKFVSTGWGANVMIKNKESKSVCLKDFKHLIIKFRSPINDTIGIRVRIVDYDNIHWAYGQSIRDPFGKPKLDVGGNRLIKYAKFDKDNKPLSAYSNEIKTVKIDLKKKNWVHFCYDGVKEINPKINESPLKMINFVLLEVGFDRQYYKLPLIHEMTGFYLHPEKEGIIDILEIGFE